MNKVLTSFVSGLFSLVCVSCYADTTVSSYDDGVAGSLLTYKVTDTVKTVWGDPRLNPAYVQDISSDYGKFRIKEGWNCC